MEAKDTKRALNDETHNDPIDIQESQSAAPHAIMPEVLELQFRWQGATIEIGHFKAPRIVTVGPHPLNDITIGCDAFDGANFPLVVPASGGRFGLFLTDAFLGKMTDDKGQEKYLEELSYSRQRESYQGHKGFVLPIESGERYSLKLDDIEIEVGLVPGESPETASKMRQWDHMLWRITSFSAIAHLAMILMFQFVPTGNQITKLNTKDRFSGLIVMQPTPPKKTKTPFKLKEKEKPKAPTQKARTSKVQGDGPQKNPGKKTVRNVKKAGILGLLQQQMGSSGTGSIFGKSQPNWLAGKMLGAASSGAAGFGFGVGRCVGTNCGGGDGGGGSLYGGGGQWGQGGKRKYRRGAIAAVGSRVRKRRVKLTPGKLTLEGSLSKEEIGRVVRRNWFMIQHCYERQLRKTPKLAGKIVLKWMIGGSGKVETVNVLQTTMNNERVENCLRRRVSRWRFPSPRGGGVVFVKYPFLFFNAGN